MWPTLILQRSMPPNLREYLDDQKLLCPSSLTRSFPETGVVLRPSFIYGTRQVGNMEIPLSLVGKPLEFILRLPPFPILKDSLPGAKALLVPPVPVEAVGSVAAKAAIGELPKGIYTVDDIAKASQSS